MTSLFTLILLALVSNGIFAKPTSGKGHNVPDFDPNKNSTLSASDLIESVNTNATIADNVGDGDIAVSQVQRNADPCTASGCLWSKNKRGFVRIPYLISNEYSPGSVQFIMSVLRSFEYDTCIRFVKLRRKHTDYLKIVYLEGCWSYVGFQGGEQLISIGAGCGYVQVIQHELLHALGFHHEQNRSDRDGYVKIIYENILPGYERNFDKVATNNLKTDYDYHSVMQYGSYAFSKSYGVLATIFPLFIPIEELGGATEMSVADKQRVNRLYECTDYLAAK